MKKFNNIVSVLVVLLICTACSSNKTETDKGGYLSFINTYLYSQDGETEVFKSDIYFLDIENNTTELKATNPFEKDYPLGIYWELKDSIIYSGISKDVYGNQVWIKDLKANETKRLTDQFANLAYLQIISDDLLLIGGVTNTEDGGAINFWEMNLNTFELSALDFDSDIDIRNITYDSENHSVLFTGYSYTELRKQLDNQQTGTFENPKQLVYEYKDGKVRKIFTPKNNTIYGLMAIDNTILYNAGSTINCYDRIKNEACSTGLSFLENPYFDHITRRIYSTDKNTVYFTTDGSLKKEMVFENNYEFNAVNNMFYIPRQ